MLAGLDRAGLLPTGTGYAELTAGVAKPWQGDLDAYVRGELGWHPTDSLSAFAFAEGGLRGVQAGVGARVTF